MDEKAKSDFRQDLTDRLIAHLEQGEIPWRKGWTDKPGAATGLPVNAVSGKPYQGGNRLQLLMVAMDRGYGDNRWLTFKQAQELGGAVMKGEKGARIEYWDKMDFWKRKDVQVLDPHNRIVDVTGTKHGHAYIKDPATSRNLGAVSVDQLSVRHAGQEYSWKQAEVRLGLLYGKSFVVFNARQCQDLGIEVKGEPTIPGNEKALNIAEGMQRDGVTLLHQGNQAYYRAPADLVVMPAPEQFVTPEEYMGTLLHEFGHATGHDKRMGRPLGNGFGSPEYAKEELVAELTSVFTQAETGVAFDDKNHAAYIGSWLEALKKDKNEVFRAAKEASNAADFLIEKGRQVEMEKSRGLEHPSPAPEPEPVLER